jgi:transcriptional regulator with GAF, ATPase, and Fis domain
MTLSNVQSAIGHEHLWRALGQLVDRVFGALGGDAALDDCLDIVVELLGADRGLVLLTMEDGTTQAINARRKGASLTAFEREEISKTIVREALDTGRCVVFQPNIQTIKSVTALGIVGALAIGLRAGAADGRRAVLYVDFRDIKKSIGQHHVDFFSSAAHLIGAVLEEHARGETTRAHLREAQGHTTEARRTPPLTDLLGTPSMRPLLDEIKASLNSNASILIVGESGTGKTLLAHAIAEASGRRPIVRAMLGASDDLNTITSELFGHERGSFSGAANKRVGLVEFANEGTLVLDELLNLPMHAQKLLLDFTQFGTYRPLGYQRAEPKKSSIRIIAATNGDLKTAMRDGRFREDLYHRLAHVVLEVPPLRSRRDDIPLLAESTLRRIDPARPWSLSVPLRRLLLSHSISWSGNVRQLERVISRARDRALMRDPEANVLVPEHLEARDLDGVEPTSNVQSTPPAKEGDVAASTWQQLQAERSRIDEREVDVIRAALARNGGVIAHAARELGVARTTLSSRIDALGLKRRAD